MSWKEVSKEKAEGSMHTMEEDAPGHVRKTGR
jgi:hypothetical protein